MELSSESPKVVVGSPLFDQMACRMGVRRLHDFQVQAITATLRGKDSFLMVPTGGGKSLCYIVPSLLLPGLVVIISPLIALMRDQQRQLQKLEIPSLAFDSLMSTDEKRKARQRILNREIKALYISPERLALPGFRDLLRDLPIALIAIDEAHCVQQWGQGFRPEYSRLGSYIAELGSAPRMALTATVTSRERAAVIESLKMRDPQLIVKSAVRDNLDLAIHRHGTMEQQKQRLVSSVLDMDGQGIVYATTRKNVEEIAGRLRSEKLAVSFYHGGMTGGERQLAQDRFVDGRAKVMVATKAFGLGIHLPDIRFVSHANMPCSLESYTQEIGRAGRDGAYARCDLHYGPRDYFLQKFMIEKSYPAEDELKKVWSATESMLSEVCREESLVPSVVKATGLSWEAVQSSVDFLLREQAIQTLETLSDDYNCYPTAYVTFGQGDFNSDRLLQALREQVAWKFDRLNAMYRLVREAGDPKDSIERYFG